MSVVTLPDGGNLNVLLARASHCVSGQFHEALRTRHVPVMHWRVMSALRSQPMSVKQIGEIVLAQQSTVSKLLDRMALAGLVRRRMSATDRRLVMVRLTQRGIRQVDPLIELARAHERCVLAPFGEANARQLVESLKRLVESDRAG